MEHYFKKTGPDEGELYVTGQEVLLTSVELPDVKPQKALAALPYAMEDELIDDVEEYHFALLGREANRYHVAIIKRAWLTEVIAPIIDEGLCVNYCAPIALVLPWDECEWTLAIHGELVWFRMGKYEGWCIEAENAVRLLMLTIDSTQQLPAILRMHLFADNKSSHEAQLIEEIKSSLNPFHIEVKEFQESLSWYAFLDEKTIKPTKEIQLLQGGFKPKNRASPTKSIWLATAAVALASVLLSISGQTYLYWALKKQAMTLDSEVLTYYQKVFPEAHTVTSPKILIQREIDKLGQHKGGQFFHVLTLLAEEINAQALQVTIDNLTYSRGKLLSNIEFTDASVLETFSQDLRSKGLNVQQDSAFSKDNKVQARLIIDTA